MRANDLASASYLLVRVYFLSSVVNAYQVELIEDLNT